jgi:hypothetical protein
MCALEPANSTKDIKLGTPHAWEDPGEIGRMAVTPLMLAPRLSVARCSIGGHMADVQIQQNPPETTSSGGSTGAVWAIVVLVLVLLVGWFIFRGGLNRTSRTDINISTPGATSANSGNGSGSGSGTASGSGATKTP